MGDMTTDTVPVSGLTLDAHRFRLFNAVDDAFGADRKDYPPEDSIPAEFRTGRASGCGVFSELFYSGGKLSDHGRVLRPEVDAAVFYATLRALMSSFAPSCELKEATCGWLIDTYTEPA